MWCVVSHALLIPLFFAWAFLMEWTPTSTVSEVGRGFFMLVAIILFGEFGRRFDFLFFSYSTHRWLWSAQLFPTLTAVWYWAIKLMQMLLIALVSVFLLANWNTLPIVVQGYGSFLVGIVFFAGFDFFVKGYKKFCLLRTENRWMSNVRFHPFRQPSQSEPAKVPGSN